MKHKYFLGKSIILFLIALSIIKVNAQTTGDLSFIGFNADGNKDFAIVALADITTNSIVYFSDNEPNAAGDGFATSTEGILKWDSGLTLIEAGTIIIFSDVSSAANRAVSIGTIEATDGSINLSASGDGLFAVKTTLDASPESATNITTWIAGIQNTTSTAASIRGDLTNTGLTVGTHYVVFASSGTPDAGYFSSSRTDQTSYANYLTQIGTVGNWTITSPSDGDGETLLPFTQEAFTLSSSDATWDGSDSNSWSLAANWVGNAVPTADSNVIIPDGLPNDPTISGSVVAGNVTLNADVSLTITGTLTNKGITTINSGASLTASSGTITGNLKYNRNLGTTNWYLISSPVVGQTVYSYMNNHSLASGITNTNNRGISTYNNTTPGWEFYLVSFTGTDEFTSGQGFSTKLTASGDISFVGTMPTSDIDISITSSTNGFNLIGNPYPSYIAANNLADATNNILKVNDTDNDFLTESTIWLWDQSLNAGAGAYTQINHSTSRFIAPGQGFFVSSNGTNTFSITEAMQSHQSTDVFNRSVTTSRPEIKLMISNGTSIKETDIFYIDGSTTDFNDGYDSSMFEGFSNNFAIYTHLVTGSQGQNLGIQSLPNTNHESLIVPIGINADAGEEIIFTANALNIPNGLNVFLEDRELGVYTQLDAANAEYAVTLTNNLNGIGRFYLHTNTQSALDVDSFDLSTVSIYKTSTTNLRIAGLQHGNAAISIFDILGKKVLQSSFEASGINDITLPNVKTGVYIIRLSTDNGTLNKKIILNN